VIGNVNSSVQLATAREAGTGEGKAEKDARRRFGNALWFDGHPETSDVLEPAEPTHRTHERPRRSALDQNALDRDAVAPQPVTDEERLLQQRREEREIACSRSGEIPRTTRLSPRTPLLAAAAIPPVARIRPADPLPRARANGIRGEIRSNKPG
jgi:prepilin-type processing-associated H-X9-DG protein